MAASKPTIHKEMTMSHEDTEPPEDSEDGPPEDNTMPHVGSITISEGVAERVTINPEQWNRWEHPTSPAPKVYEAIMLLMQQVESVAKGGQAPAEAGGYRYRSVEDVLAKIGPAARAFGLALQSRITACEYHTKATERHTWTWCRLRVMYRFTSLEDGSTFEFESAGEGRDNTDKATSKAMSMALKYGLSQAFLIDLGEPDPDGEKPMDTPNGDVQRRQESAEDREERARQAGVTTHRSAQHQPAQDPSGRARQALAAAQNQDRVKTKADLDKIAYQAQKEGLMGEQVGGVLLADRLYAIKETLE